MSKNKTIYSTLISTLLFSSVVVAEPTGKYEYEVNFSIITVTENGNSSYWENKLEFIKNPFPKTTCAKSHVVKGNNSSYGLMIACSDGRNESFAIVRCNPNIAGDNESAVLFNKAGDEGFILQCTTQEKVVKRGRWSEPAHNKMTDKIISFILDIATKVGN